MANVGIDAFFAKKMPFVAGNRVFREFETNAAG